MCSFPLFSPTCYGILNSNFAHDFVLMYFRSSLSVVTLRQFLKELCLFVKLKYKKGAVFRIFLLHALIYWAEIFHMTLFKCTTDQVQVSLLCIRLALRPSIYFLHMPPIFTDNWIEILNLTLVSLMRFFRMFMTGVLCTVCGAQVYFK